jgi:hypothetical protein
MKKFLGILVIAGALVACNNSGESTTGSDSTNADSTTMNQLPPATSDSTNMGDSSRMGNDTSKRSGTDTTKSTKKSK